MDLLCSDSGGLRAWPVALKAAQQTLHPLLDPSSHRVSGRGGQTGGEAGWACIQTFLVAKLREQTQNKYWWLALIYFCLRQWCQIQSCFIAHHARSLHSLTQTGSVGFTPEHVAGEISGTFCHDKSKGVDIFAYTHERQETHSTFWQHLIILEGGGKKTDKVKLFFCFFN